MNEQEREDFIVVKSFWLVVLYYIAIAATSYMLIQYFE